MHFSKPPQGKPGSQLQASRHFLRPLALLGLASIGSAQVAEFQLPAPQEADFIFRGTLPLPTPGNIGLDNRLQLRVVGTTQTFPAQVEVVSRYAGDGSSGQTGGPDVIELLADVSVPSGTVPGSSLALEVVVSNHTPSSFQATTDVAALTSGPCIVRATDVFGNVYTADIFEDFQVPLAPELQVLRSGEVAHQVRTHSWLLPDPNDPTWEENARGTMPHLFGVHAYVTQYAGEDFISVDLRIHNGADGLDPTTTDDDSVGDVFFDSIELLVDGDWTLIQAFDDPFFNPTPTASGTENVWSLVRPLGQVSGNSGLHFMTNQGQFVRRLCLAYTGEGAGTVALDRAESCLTESWLGFNRPGPGTQNSYLSWWNPATSRYFAQNDRLPHPSSFLASDLVAMANGINNDFTSDSSSLATGLGASGGGPSTNLLTNAMGWAHPAGVSHGLNPGGNGINFWEGIRTAILADQTGYRMQQIDHRTTTCREPLATYNADGTPATAEQLEVQGTYLYMPIVMSVNYTPYFDQYTTSDPFGFLGANAGDSQRNAANLLGLEPSYGLGGTALDKDDLDGFDPHAMSHTSRNTRSQKALVWLGNDAMAKDDLFLQAELARILYSPLPTNDADPFSAGAQYSSIGMLSPMRYVNQHPGWGAKVGRSQGWLMDTVAAAYALGSDAQRGPYRSWTQSITALLKDAQNPVTGNIMASKGPVASDIPGHRGVQAISEAILGNGLVSVLESVYRGSDATRVTDVENLLKGSTAGVIHPTVWNSNGTGDGPGPSSWAATGPIDYDLAPYNFTNNLPFPYYGTDSMSPAGGGAPIYGTHTSANTLVNQSWCMLGIGHRLWSQSTYIDHAEEMAGGTQAALKAALRSTSSGDLENRVSIFVEAEDLGILP
ncbi:MAG: hypothetical protein P1V81_14895 [Planctomycetota bacterium]|nr:hypothetical protein [Planctomycetota bacterium]